MAPNPLENLARIGQLKAEPRNAAEVQRMLDMARMRLVDDLMEPFRPMVDWTVWQLQHSQPCHVNADTKRALVKSLYLDLVTPTGNTPVFVAIQKLATSLAQVLTNERTVLDLPHPCVPMAHVLDTND